MCSKYQCLFIVRKPSLMLLPRNNSLGL